MPQMAPLWWLTLMLLFLMLFTSYNIMNFYIISYKPTFTSNKKMQFKLINWKW